MAFETIWNCCEKDWNQGQ